MDEDMEEAVHEMNEKPDHVGHHGAGGSAKRAIRKMSDLSKHRICAGQVIPDVAAAVKELLENAIDAGASSVGMLCAAVRHLEWPPIQRLRVLMRTGRDYIGELRRKLNLGK
jgi:hypothetical protein